MFREGLKSILENDVQFELVGEAGDGIDGFRNHRAAVMHKLDCHSRYELTRYAKKLGLIDVDLM